MILNLILTLLFVGLALVLVLAGLFTKKKILWISGIVSLVFGGFFGSLLLQQSYAKAKELVAVTADKIPDGTANAVEVGGELVGEGFGRFFNGISKGLDNSVDAVKVAPHTDLIEQGLRFQVAESYNEKGWNDNLIVVYVIYEKDFAGMLQMKVYNHKKQEMGRVKVWAENKEGEAEYLEFQFDKYTDYLQGGFATLEASDDSKPESIGEGEPTGQ